VAVTLIVMGMVLDIPGFVVGGVLIVSMLPVLLTLVWQHYR
jgi:hypothetical protein